MAWVGLDTRIWNLTMGAGALVMSACGPAIILPGETGEGTDSVGSASDTDTTNPTNPSDPTEPTTVATTVGPECEVDSDCSPGEYCDAGHCVPDDYCEYGCCEYDGCCYYAEGPDGTSYITHCQPPYECFDDSECGSGSICEFGYCNDLDEITVCPATEMIPVPIDGEGDDGVLSLAFVDVDGDGSEDLIIGRESGPELLLAPGTGPATSLPSSVAAQGIVGGDFDGDGDTDLVLIDDDDGGRVSWILGDGAGGFAAGETTAGFGLLRNLSTLDYNGDGALDLAFERDDFPTVLLGDGAAGPSETVALEGFSGPADSLAVGDFNLDTFTGVVTSSASTIEMWFGSDPPDGAVDASLSSTWNQSLQILAADFDSSSLSDIVGWQNADSIDPWLYVETFSEGNAVQNVYWLPGQAVVAGVGNVDGDGDPDIVFSGAGTLDVIYGQGSPGLRLLECRTSTPVGQDAQTMAIGDLDGDGRDEVALGLGTAVTVFSLL